MGDEISTHYFEESAYKTFRSKLEDETSLLKEWLRQNKLDDNSPVGGFEQEAWLVDDEFKPAPLNEEFMAVANRDDICAELAKFNIELNVTPLMLEGRCLNDLENELKVNWEFCRQVANELGCKVIMIGILPTVHDDDLTLVNLSGLNRYKALNEQVMQARKGVPMRLEITGNDHLESEHSDVMLESAATSFQIHRQIPAKQAAPYINHSMILSAITVAVSANSPYLFGKQLWEETRIPLFEQAVEIGGLGSAAHGPIRRVTFGNGYIRNDVFECFQENLEHYPILLPVELDDSNSDLPYLRLHNGTIWRWNRPLIGFDENNTPHVRVEHRVVSAGPTILDEIANTAFYYGMLEWMMMSDKNFEREIEHAQAKVNFYEAARFGLNAHIQWTDNKKIQIDKLIIDELLPGAREGLKSLGIDESDIKDYMGIIEARTRTLRTGASWQKTFISQCDPEMSTMLEAYYENQQSNNPVHDWKTG